MIVTVVIARAEDLPGQWVAHCLDFDIISHGATVEEAARMVIEATKMTIEDDARAGLDPTTRRAPEDHWRAAPSPTVWTLSGPNCYRLSLT